MQVDLLFVGDSFTWGEELQGPENYHYKREMQRFSGVMSIDLDKSYDNISRSGVSNDWIVKKTVEWFEAGNSCDTAIIQFSHEKRWLWYDKQGKQHHMPSKYKGKGQQSYLYTSTEKEQAQHMYMKHVVSKDSVLDNYWKNMFMIRNYLKDKCKIVHLSLHTAPYGTIGKDYKENFWYKCVGDVSILALKPLLDGCRENFTPTLNSDILDNNYNKRFSGVHPSAKGHQKIAENITRLIK